MAVNRGYGSLDLFKLFAAVLVIANHTSPLDWSPKADFVLTDVVSRLAVPFFFMTSGFFFFRPKQTAGKSKPAVKRFMLRIGMLYGIGIVLYLPVNVYSGHFGGDSTASSIAKDLFFGGTFYHLWYLPALMIGTLIVLGLRAKLSNPLVLAVTGALYAIGLFGDSYYGVIMHNDGIAAVYGFLFEAFGQTRNGLFFAPLYVAFGAMLGAAGGSGASEMSAARRNIARKRYALLFAVSFCALLAEGIALRRFAAPLHDDMYLALVPAELALFALLIAVGGKSHPRIRYVSTAVYLIHPLVIVLVRGFAKLTGLQPLLIDNGPVFFAAVAALSLLFATAIAILALRPSSPKPGEQRAWVEINLAHLDHNARALQQALPSGTGLMAVVKADAYGHGSVQVAKRLYGSGIRRFAVAEIAEGIALRKRGVKGEILVLGYTPTDRLGDLVRWKLTQTVIHADDARRLQAHGGKFNVHVKIDTGMNRLGEQSDHDDEILSMYRHSRLQVMGTYSHLAEADSLDPHDIAFSRKQIDRFRHVVSLIWAAGLHPGLLHLQSSYGILNFPDLAMDLARPGIALYGLLSTEGAATRTKLDLRPVLSLRAGVSRVHVVEAGESVGYGRSFTAAADTKIATVAIGYADGIPRELSERGGSVLIHGKRAPIVGRICMDQLTVDVSGVGDVRQGDTVTIIGEDGGARITAGEMAERTGTITNEIVCALGMRAARQYPSERRERPARTLARGFHVLR